jgi:hypothetical protein
LIPQRFTKIRFFRGERDHNNLPGLNENGHRATGVNPSSPSCKSFVINPTIDLGGKVMKIGGKLLFDTFLERRERFGSRSRVVGV